jgi:[acyl-carrier-protein] S-malonyltransferase
LEPANFNGGGQIVIAGDLPAIKRALSLAKERRARAVPLKVSAPFHCRLMRPAAEGLAEALAAVHIARPEIPVVSNVDAEPNQDGGRVAQLLVRQVTAPVRWEASVRRLVAMGSEQVLEVGPGKVLSGLLRRIAGDLSLHNIEGPDDLESLARDEVWR